jgi:mannose-6-phosphate isomerase-like protein (cupin superfamily)
MTLTQISPILHSSVQNLQCIEISKAKGKSSMSWQTGCIASEPNHVAPFGAEVRVLAHTARGSMAHFVLSSKAISNAMAYRTVDEIWLFLSGRGRVWRCLDGQEEIVDVGPGVAITIPAGTKFQFRCDTYEPLAAVATTIPSWPGKDEIYPVEGCWQATV